MSFKPRAIPSPFQSQNRANRGPREYRADTPPVRQEIRNLLGAHDITVEFSEDTDTLQSFSHVSGMIPVICTIKMNGKIAAIGRGMSLLTKINRNLDRAIGMALNGSFLSAANNLTKYFDLLRLSDAGGQKVAEELRERHETVLAEVSEVATEKQKNYLAQLADQKLDGTEREEFLASLDAMTKDQASEAIQNLIGQ